MILAIFECLSCLSFLIRYADFVAMKKLCFLPFLLVFMVSCNQTDDTYNKLKQVDALLYETLDESVDSLFNTIKPEELNTPEKSMYYNMLETGVKYRMGEREQNDSIINRCIDYYEKTGDKEKLAMSIFTRACINFNIDDENNMLDLKRAATLAESTGNYALMAKTYSGLTVYTGNSGEPQLSLKYAQKGVAAAKKSEKEALLVYAYLQLSIAYRTMGVKDSALFYARQSELYVNDFQPIYKAYIYYNLGELFRNNNDSLAESYLKQSLSCEPLSQTYKSLADIYEARGDQQSASDMWNNAIKNSNFAQRAKVFDAMASSEYKKGNFEECCNALINKDKNLTDFYEWKLKNKTSELESKYNLSLYQQKVRNQIIIAVFAVVLIAVVLVFLYHSRMRRIESKRTELELNYEKAKNTLALMEKRIADLETDKKSKTSELTVLKSKTEKLKKKIQNNLQHGHDLYDKLKNDESTINWTDEDVLCVIDYISTIYPGFVLSLDSDYQGLNTQQKLFVIAMDLFNKDIDTMCSMFALEKQSYYTKRYRIKQKSQMAQNLH